MLNEAYTEEKVLHDINNNIIIKYCSNALVLLTTNFYFLGLDCPVTMKYTESPI